eukprot:Phypoly_transcript_00302.p1 GENE.Phypoly_transcript_00302~~Phypoly_transcript_00302.p1  ORF type:complete len:1760 (+),score=298.94 Phypoly_transcript_00302:614-5281(+)
MKELHKCLKVSVGPAFLCFLGNKYGYRPFPAKIPHDILNNMWPRICESELINVDPPELAERVKKMKVEEVMDALTDEEKYAIYDVSDILFIPQWFWLNLNVQPPVFDLQNITTHLPNFRSTNTEDRNQASAQWWRTFEAMQLLLRKGATALNKEEEEKYIISVTNEEVFNGIINNQNRKDQSILLTRRIKDGESIREDGPLRKFIDAGPNAPIPLVTFSPPPGPPPEKPPTSALTLDCEATSLLGQLKEQVSVMVPPHALLDYVIDKRHLGSEKEDIVAKGEVVADVEPGKFKKGEPLERYLREVCEVVCKSLGDHILEGFKKNNIITSAVFQEVVLHHTFLKVKLRGFVERSKLQDSVLAYCNKEEPENRSFVVHAPSGSGKTALIAWIANKIHELYPKAAVITRFLGTTPSSTDVLLLIRSLCQQLLEIFPDDANDENSEVAKNGTAEDVNALFVKLLTHAKTNDEKIFLFIDSIDQLLPNSNAYTLDWLPISLPPNVHLVVSVLTPSAEEEANPNLAKSRPPNLHALLMEKYEAIPNKETYFLNIPQLLPSEAEQIVDSKLGLPDEEGRTKKFSKEQKDVVVKSSGASFTPLYLSIAMDLATQWKSYTPIASCTLAGTTRDIILQLFRKLEAVHGKLLVSHALGYLTASKYGLSSQNLEDILSCDDEVLNDVYQWWVPPVRRLPPLLWKRLKEDLGGYLVEKGLGSVTLISWFHRQFKEAAEEEYLAGEAFLARNRVLAKYFDGTLGTEERLILPQPLKYSEVKFNDHKISSLPYHQAFIDPTLFHSSLYNLEFIEDKIRAGMPSELIRDYEFAISLLQKNTESRQQFGDHIAKLKDILDFLKSNLNILLKNPSLILMLALNQPDGSPTHSMAVEQRGKAIYANLKVLQLLNKEAPLTGVLTMEHQESVDRAHFESNDERVVAHTTKHIKIYDVNTGFELHSIPKDKSDSSSLPGGKLVCINRGKMRIYDANNGTELGSFDDSNSTIRELMGLPDEKTLVILGKVGSSTRVELWDYVSMTFLRNLPGPDGATQIRHSLDGKQVFCSCPGASVVSIYNPHTGDLVQTIEHSAGVHFSYFSADGKYLYSAGYDGNVHVFEIAAGKPVATIKAHTDALKRVISSPVGNRVATGSADKTIKIWDNTTHELKELLHLKGHTDNVEQIFYSKDGKRLLSVSDTHVIVWDATTGNQISTLKGHSGRVFPASFSLDTQKVLTGSTDRTMRLWDLTARVEVKESPNHTKEVVKSQYSANGKIAVTASDDQTIKVWDPQGKLLRTIPQDRKWDPNFAIDPNGEIIFTVLNKNLLAFNAQSGGNVLNVKAHTREMYPYCLVSSTGLVATFTDKEAKLWDGKTFKELKKFGGHEEEIHIVTFSPDGTLFVTVSTDTLAVWNIKTGEKIHDLGGPDQNLRTLEYTPNGKYLVGYGSGISVWSFVEDPEVTSTNTEAVMLALPQCESSLILYIPSADYRLSAFDMAVDPVDVPVHVHKALARLLTYKDEVWTWAHNELVLWKVKNGNQVAKDTQFFVPRSITSLARHDNLVLIGTPDGSVYHFMLQ